MIPEPSSTRKWLSHRVTKPMQLVKDPVYCQLNTLLRDLIRSGEYRKGDQFLTEREIAQRYGISRATANKALSSLVAEGVVAFKKGVGTFVQGELLDYDLRALVSFTEKARAAGRTPTTRVLDFATVDASGVPAEIAAALKLSGADRAHRLSRLRLADQAPVILERRFINARYCPNLVAADVGGSLYETLTARFSLNVSGADESIRAVIVSGEDAALLNVAAGSAALLVEAIGFVNERDPLWHERTLYRGDAYEFHNQLGPIRSGRPATGALIARSQEGV